MAFKASNSGIFSRLSAKRKRSGGKQTSSDDAEPDNHEEIAEEFASLTDEHMLEKASVDVQSEISGIKHPVMYDIYNLCEMAFENKRLFFKVKTLRVMCKHFEVTSISRDTKSTLARKKMVEDCSFAKK